MFSAMLKEEEDDLKLCSIDKMPVEEDARVTTPRDKLCVSLDRDQALKKENEQLKQELIRLKAQIASLRARDSDRGSTLWKKVHSSISSNSSAQEKQIIHSSISEEGLSGSSVTGTFSKPELWESSRATKERSPRVSKPPPRPTHLPSMPKIGGKEALVPPPPPMPTRLPSTPNIFGKEAQVPPPSPPPLPLKSHGRSGNAVRRVPEVVELYRSLTRREGKQDSLKTGALGTSMVTNSRDMIGEIENRSAYLSAIKSDVETQGEFINFLAREVENAAYKEISDVEAFVKWLDEELSYLVDERAVLKHFPCWPERKADAMREAAFSYRDLKTLELEISSFHDNMHQPVNVALKRMQALQDKLEHSVHSLERARESSSKRYKDFKIPWEWMLNTGIIAQLKSGSMKLAKQYMNRVANAVQLETFSDDEDLLHQGVRFAFRVHQFVGGFDEESRHAFQELRKLASNAICDT